MSKLKSNEIDLDKLLSNESILRDSSKKDSIKKPSHQSSDNENKFVFLILTSLMKDKLWFIIKPTNYY